MGPRTVPIRFPVEEGGIVCRVAMCSASLKTMLDHVVVYFTIELFDLIFGSVKVQ